MDLPRFEGEVETRWLRHSGEDRDMSLLDDFVFLDSRGVRWPAPSGRTVDGASIPEILWSKVVGTPFVGDYRRATVVHDVACQDKTRPHEEVHFMLYEAMLCDGVSEEQAFLMYTAVRLFGPKWPSSTARRRSHEALRRFDITRLVATVDTALGERTRWKRRGPSSAHPRRGRRAAARSASFLTIPRRPRPDGTARSSAVPRAPSSARRAARFAGRSRP
jgi:Protein of unknown function (DUF1353)